MVKVIVVAFSVYNGHGTDQHFLQNKHGYKDYVIKSMS